MKLIYLTDIHGSFNRVATLLFDTVADAYIIGGDLIDIPFYSIDTAIHYHELQSYLIGLRKKMEKEDMVLEDFVDSLMEIPDISEEIINSGSNYQHYTIRARRVMQQKYKVLENIFSVKPTQQIFTLPGNYDMDLKFTSLHLRDLHLHWYHLNGLKIAGYGGADVWTAGIPERYIVKYRGGIGINDKENEMHTFFRAIRPDIIVTHQPAHGIHDRISYIGPSGSPALRTFCDNHPVRLCLTGHIHSDWGFRVEEDTVYLNPSNFGEVTTVKGEVSEGGFFYQVELSDTSIERIQLRKLVGEKVHDIADYNRDRGAWHEQIIDRKRFLARKNNENFDTHVKKYSHIPEIELYKEIKNFFRMFQTQETEERVDELEKVVSRITIEFGEIAMDIVGSVNMGLSQQSSDIDIVLYLRCGTECDGDYELCDKFATAKKVIRETLKDRYNFDVIDCVNLDIVEKSVHEENYECETTQRFVAYRSICRPINYKFIAPVEDLLNRNIEFRKEMEGSIRSYFKIFATTSTHIRSFDKYEARLKAIGIKIPESIRDKIRRYLQVSDREA